MIRVVLLAVLAVVLSQVDGATKNPCILGCRSQCKQHCSQDKPINKVAVASCQAAMDEGYAKSGVYLIAPDGRKKNAVRVSCDFSGEGGAWTILMKREYNHEIGRFNRLWDDYAAGFGVISGDHWLGLDAMNKITSQGDHEVSIDTCVTIGENICNQQVFKKFYVGDAGSKYRLTLQDHSSAESTKNAAPYFHYAGRYVEFDGKMFSTRDQDNDAHATLHCGEKYGAGWWFPISCLPHLSAVKIVNVQNGDKGYGIFSTHATHIPLASVTIKVRPFVAETA